MAVRDPKRRMTHNIRAADCNGVIYLVALSTSRDRRDVCVHLNCADVYTYIPTAWTRFTPPPFPRTFAWPTTETIPVRPSRIGIMIIVLAKSSETDGDNLISIERAYVKSIP